MTACSRRWIWLAVVAGLLPASRSSAQTRPGQFTTGASYEAYWFGDADAIGIESISLLSLPFAASAQLGGGVGLGLPGAYARGSVVRNGGTTATLQGLTDTELRLTLGLGRNLATITAIALLPTGRAELDEEEGIVAGTVAADVLPFRVTNWGTGGGFGANAAVAVPLGPSVAAGFSAGYVIGREFEPVEGGDLGYRPGSQLILAAALDATVGSSGKASLRVGYSTHTEDQIQQRTVCTTPAPGAPQQCRQVGPQFYQAGDRLSATASYAFVAGERGSAIVHAGFSRRDDGFYYQIAGITPTRTVLSGGVGGRFPLGSTVLQPSADIRLLSQAEGADEGFTAGLGAALEVPLGSVTVVPSVRARLGSVQVSPGTNSGLTGAELGLTVRFGGRRSP